MGFHFKYGAIGLVLGRVAGKTTQVLSYMYLVLRMDYDKEVELARKRVDTIDTKPSSSLDTQTPALVVKDPRSSSVV